MSEEKRETREALLGELESIKDLLSEDEWDDIPVLSDTIVSPEKDAKKDAENLDSQDANEITPAETATSDDRQEQQLDLMSAMAEEPVIETTPLADEDPSLDEEFSLALNALSDNAATPASEDRSDLPAFDAMPPILESNERQNSELQNSEQQNNEFESPDFKNTAFQQSTVDASASEEQSAPSSEDAAAELTEGTTANYQSDIDAAVDKLNLDLNLSDDALTEDDLEQLEIGELTDPVSATDTFAETPQADDLTDTDAFNLHDTQPFSGEALQDEVSEDEQESNEALANHEESLGEQLEHDLEELTHDLEAFDEALTPEVHSLDANNDASSNDAANNLEAETAEIDDQGTVAIHNAEAFSETEAIDAPETNDEPRAEFQHDAFDHLTPDVEALPATEEATADDATVEEAQTLNDLAVDDLTSNEDTTAAEETLAPTTEDGHPLPPGVLPGQQSLFSGSAKSDPARSHRQTKPTGENPFLPKHIRDRLHTNKALVDIIKESPLPPPQAAKPLSEHVHDAVKEKLPLEVPAERMHDLVEEVIALYMPRIEAELRERLLMEVKVIEPEADKES